MSKYQTRLLTLIITLAAFHSLFIVCAGQEPSRERVDEERVRTELAVVLAERDEAAEKNDIERFLSFYATDFTWRIKGGRTLTRQETEQVIRLSTGGDTLEHKQHSTIKSVKARGNEAVLEVQSDSFMKQRLRDSSIRETTSSGTIRETWVKTGQGWKLKLLDNARYKDLLVTVNGQKVDPLKTVNDPLIPEPNVEDLPVLQEGYALVLVYRLNDGTIVKTPFDCDDVRLAEMTGGSFIKVKLMPGNHSFHSEKGSPTTINLESGKIYFLVIELAAGFPKGRGVLKVDMSGAGPTAYKLPKLMELKPLGRNNIKDLSRVVMEKQ